MIRATSIVRKLAVKAERVSDSVTLDHEHRHRRRIKLTSDGDLEFLLDLDKASGLDDGDALKLEDGRLILVKAAPQQLLEIKAENPLRLLRVAWHIGNAAGLSASNFASCLRSSSRRSFSAPLIFVSSFSYSKITWR